MLLQEVPKAYKTQINDVLLTALALVVSRWTDSKSVLFNLEGHGREDLFEGVDLSRTVGWLTAMFPVVLKLSDTYDLGRTQPQGDFMLGRSPQPPLERGAMMDGPLERGAMMDGDGLGKILKSVKEQLRAIPNKGIGYGLLLYLNQDTEINAQLATIPTPEISFNYLGQFTQVLNTESLISPASESSGQNQSLQAQRTNLLDINAVIAEEQLQINWTYSSNIYNHATIESIAREFVCELQDIIAHCLEPENTGFTPSDFPLIKLNQSELDLVLARVALTSELSQNKWQNLEDIYPLSPMQAGMLFESLYAPDSGVYFEQITCTFTGLNVRAFEQAWQMLVARHSIFRTAFEWESLSTPVQVVYRQVQVTLNTIDWRDLTKVEQQAQLETFLSSERQQGLQLSQAPLMRLHLLHLDENTYQFVWCHHHILLDGWSLPLVFQDLFEYYQALTDGVSLALQPTRSYRNYIAWLQQQDLDSAKEFWRQKLQGFSAPTPLTVDRPLSNQERSGYSEQQIYFTSSVTAQAVDFVKQHQLTMNNLVQVAWGLLLSRYSSQTDVVFGATVSGRPPGLLGVESMVGLFINTVPVRLQIGETDLLSLLKELQAQQVESTQFSYCSLVEIQGLSEVPRGTSLFDSIVVFENYPVNTDVLQDNSDLTVENYCGIEQTNYPLTVVVIPGEQLCLKLSYDTSRFEQGTINRMLGHFVTLLQAIVANPQQQISQLPLLTASEQHQLLVEWNETSVDYPQDRCIHQLFEEQVALTPNAVAVVCEDQQLTYHQLNCRANQLAHYLQSLGVGADVLVGICVERSIEMIVGLLGILKAGGAYVPLDPEYPSERLNFILEDAGVSVLLTQQHLVEKFPSLPAQVVCLDSWSLISQFSQHNPITLVRATHLAYAIYTSGSTGTPKGVAIAHLGLLNLVFWHQLAFEITSSDKATQLAGTGFDAAVWEIWPYLTAGASLYLVKSELVTSPVHLRDWLIAQKITVSFVPTPVAIELLSLEWNAEIALRYLLIGGDRLHQYPSASLPFQVVNNYGPTENTVVTTSGVVVAQQPSQILPSIGRAIANTQLYILDSHLQPVPIGVPGELHIAGVGLAKGYLNRPDLTQQKFIPNPFRRSRGVGEQGRRGVKEDQLCLERLYKTGDLARYLPDGSIEYLGRIDNQVKIRGFRIELGEIEAVLSQHEHVQACCAIARVDSPGEKRLVAYIVPQPQAKLTSSKLRQFLKTKLPEYMVPSVIMFLESLPLTPNGKVDRRALPVPESRAGIEVSFIAPRTPVEAKLAQIWSQILRVDVGIHDNFFSLGGDSIISIQIIAKAKQAGIELTLKQLFANPTIAELATVVDTTTSLSIEQRLVTGTLPLTPIQHWFFEQQFPQPHHFNQSFLLTVPSNINIEFLEQVWRELIKHHDALRLQFTQTHLNWQAIHAEPSDRQVVSCFDLRTLTHSEQTTAIENTANALQASLNLSENLVQVALFQLGNNKQARLLIVIHHLVVDGVSWRILLEDLQTGYAQLSEGQVIQLPNKTTAFKDWAQQLREYSVSSRLKSELSYWLSASSSEVASIPIDRANGENTVASANVISVSLNSAETQSLLQEVPKAYNTQINDVLLTALVLVLSRWTDSNSVLFNLEGHGREDIIDSVDLSRTVGWFTTMFPVVLKLSAKELDNLGQVLKSVKEQLRAIPNKGIGYGLLRYLNQDAEIRSQLATIPTPEISFNYLGQFTQVVNTESLTSPASESSGQSQSLQGQRANLLDINAIITDEQLQIHWTYSSNIHEQATIESIAREFVCKLQDIIAHCLEPENTGFTPTDFPLLEFNQSELDRILGNL
ncbi:amino acid adenylation domain-containing protein [Tolypothrix bouteillei VB521301_2]|uniref:amino acid adenylation domain-containing protein n=1 Tax=Tolypothrix bouteillei TaxID=1246981 RepID=UPI0038B4D568